VNNSGYKACKGMQQKVAAIKAEEKDELKIMMALQNLVMNEMQTYHVNMMETGFRLRTPAEVWKSNGGTKLEKTCLLTALLLQANINAKAIAVIPEKFYDPQMGNLLAVQDFVIQVNPKQHGQFYISATAHANKNLKAGLTGNKLLTLEAAIESLKTFEIGQHQNLIQFGAGFVVQEDGKILGTFEVELENLANPYLKTYNDSNYVYRIVNGFSKKEIKSFDLKKFGENKSFIKFEFEKENAFKNEANYLFYTLPAPADHLDNYHLSRLPLERKLPLKLDAPIKLDYSYSISIPSNYKAVLNAKSVKLENEAGKLFIQFEEKGDVIVITKKLELPSKIIPAKDYKAFRELMINWFDKNYSQLILKK
jgi:Domain of Unknown Function with PDB structure (DUF3858)